MPHQSEDLNFAVLTFSRSELRKAIKSIIPKTKEVEEQGVALARKPTAASSFKFSKDVCDWASGQRVWRNLERYNPDKDKLAKELCSWFQDANKTRDDGEAIAPGIKIKGLGVSFASKHLRMLYPQRFAVLDSVLSEELGFALNIAGYKLFLQTLRKFRRQYRLKDNVSTLETGIYGLVQEKRGAR